MTIYTKMERLTQKIAEQCRNIERKEIETFLQTIIEAQGSRIFVHGVGRSGLVGRAFAMRLMHLGFQVYVVGETTTPAITSKDVLVSLSGSGETSSVVNIARITKEKVGATIIAITSHHTSTLAKLATHVIIIKGRKLEEENRDYDARQMVGSHEPLTPLGTLFELACMVFLDSMVEELMRRLNKTEDVMKKHHTNLE